MTLKNHIIDVNDDNVNCDEQTNRTNICCSWIWRKISLDLRNSRDHCSYNWFSSVITIFVLHVDILTLLYMMPRKFSSVAMPFAMSDLTFQKIVHDFSCASNSRCSIRLNQKKDTDFSKFVIYCRNKWIEISFARNKYSSV